MTLEHAIGIKVNPVLGLLLYNTLVGGVREITAVRRSPAPEAAHLGMLGLDKMEVRSTFVFAVTSTPSHTNN